MNRSLRFKFFVPPLARHFSPQSGKLNTPAVLSSDHIDLKPFPRFKILDGMKEKLGLYRYHRWIIEEGSKNLYIATTDQVPLENFLKYCNLPDTMDSWFCVTSLHVWMVMVRCNSIDRGGCYCGRNVVKFLWKDYDQRLSLLKIQGAKTKKEINTTFGEIFFANLFGFDEGLLSNDKVLAASLWRHFFSFRDVDPLILEMMVHYVRVQVKYLAQYDDDYIISKGIITWKPFPPLIP